MLRPPVHASTYAVALGVFRLAAYVRKAVSAGAHEPELQNKVPIPRQAAVFVAHLGRTTERRRMMIMHLWTKENTCRHWID